MMKPFTRREFMSLEPGESMIMEIPVLITANIL